MAAMLRPTYSAILNHARDGQPAIVFVPSRWHALRAALELLTFAAADGQPKRFLRVRPRLPPELIPGLWASTGRACPAPASYSSAQARAQPQMRLRTRSVHMPSAGQMPSPSVRTTKDARLGSPVHLVCAC